MRNIPCDGLARLLGGVPYDRNGELIANKRVIMEQ